jgi:hypothetical protein
VARSTPRIKVPPPKVPEINLEEAEIPLKFILSGLKPYQIIRELKKMTEEALKKGEDALVNLSDTAKELLTQAWKSDTKRRTSFHPYRKLPPRYWLSPEERKKWFESRKKKKKTKKETSETSSQTKNPQTPQKEDGSKSTVTTSVESGATMSTSLPPNSNESSPIMSESPQ